MRKVTKNKYGKYTNEIDTIIQKVRNFSLDDVPRLNDADAYATADADATATADAYADATADAYAAAYDADADAYAAAAAADAYADAYAAYAATADYWRLRRISWWAILAYLAKDKINQNQFNLLMAGWNYFIAKDE